MALLWPILQSLLFTLSISALLILTLASGSVSAQETVRAPLTVGQEIPDALWKASLVSVSPKMEKTISLEDFRGKAIIIDFWTSWCAPCLKNMPSLDSIHHANKKQLQVVMMNASTSQAGFVKERKFIKDYLAEHNQFVTPLLLRNDLYRQYFYFRVIPHYVWIGVDGKIKALTDHLQFSPSNIAKLITGAELGLEIKSR